MRVIGLEPTCLTASDPKSDTSANFATPAFLSLSLKAISLKPKERENSDFYCMPAYHGYQPKTRRLISLNKNIYRDGRNHPNAWPYALCFKLSAFLA